MQVRIACIGTPSTPTALDALMQLTAFESSGRVAGRSLSADAQTRSGRGPAEFPAEPPAGAAVATPASAATRDPTAAKWACNSLSRPSRSLEGPEAPLAGRMLKRLMRLQKFRSRIKSLHRKKRLASFGAFDSRES